MAEARRLADAFVHLGMGGGAVPQPPFDGIAWYEAYGARHGDDGAEGRLVSQHSFSESWDSWEMHPSGSEVVICTAGSMLLTQEFPDGKTAQIMLRAGDYAINPPGVWHTADIPPLAPGDEGASGEGESGTGGATAIFITAGEGTQHRPR